MTKFQWNFNEIQLKWNVVTFVHPYDVTVRWKQENWIDNNCNYFISINNNENPVSYGHFCSFLNRRFWHISHCVWISLHVTIQRRNSHSNSSRHEYLQLFQSEWTTWKENNQHQYISLMCIFLPKRKEKTSLRMTIYMETAEGEICKRLNCCLWSFPSLPFFPIVKVE